MCSYMLLHIVRRSYYATNKKDRILFKIIQEPVSLFINRLKCGLTTFEMRVRKQPGTENNKSKEGRQEMNGGAKGRDASAEELDRETGEEQITVGRARRKDGGWQTAEESGRVTCGGQEETREANAEMGGLLSEMRVCRRGGRLEEEDKRQRRVEKTIR